MWLLADLFSSSVVAATSCSGEVAIVGHGLTEGRN